MRLMQTLLTPIQDSVTGKDGSEKAAVHHYLWLKGKSLRAPYQGKCRGAEDS